MTTTTQQAEQLWVSAHEHVRRGDFASATRDLAACFQILQEHNDPRLPEVHRRWTEVHQLAVEEATQGRGQQQPAAAQQAAPNLEAEAEAAANAGDLDGAIALYEVALARSPSNELIAERLLELRNARPRAAELTSSTPPVEASGPTPALIDDEALAASIDVGVDVGAGDVGVAVGSEVDVDAPTLVSARPAATIVRDEAVEASIPVEPIPDDDAAFNAGLAVGFDDGFDDGIHEAVTLVPARSAEPSLEPQAAASSSTSSSIPQWGSDLLSTTAEAPISGEDPRWSSVEAPVETAPIETIELPSLSEPPSVDDELSFADVITQPPQPARAVVEEPVSTTSVESASEQISGDDPRWGEAAPSSSEQSSGDDPRWGEAAPSSIEQISGDDPRWGEAAPSTSSEQISGDDPRWGEAAASSSEQISGDDPRFGEAAPSSSEQISGDDPRWGESSTSNEQITGDDPRWGGGVSAPISGDDPHWGAPTSAPLMAAEDAPVGMPSLDIAIDTGMSVSGSEADELPVEISDDLVMLDDEAAALTTVPPQPASIAAAPVVAAVSSSSSSSDGLPADPVSMLEALLLRVRDNRRAA